MTDWAEQMKWSAGKGEWKKSQPRRNSSSAQSHYRRLAVGRAERDDPRAMVKLREEVEARSMGMTAQKYMQLASKRIAANQMSFLMRRKVGYRYASLFNRWKYAYGCDDCRSLVKKLDGQHDDFTNQIEELNLDTFEQVESSKARHAEEMESLKSEYRTKTLTRFVGRMQNRVFSRAWDTWVDNIDDSEERRIQQLLVQPPLQQRPSREARRGARELRENTDVIRVAEVTVLVDDVKGAVVCVGRSVGAAPQRMVLDVLAPARAFDPAPVLPGAPLAHDVAG